jgi:hypothetical protein
MGASAMLSLGGWVLPRPDQAPSLRVD